MTMFLKTLPLTLGLAAAMAVPVLGGDAVCDFQQDIPNIFTGDVPIIYSPADADFNHVCTQQFGGLWGTTDDAEDILSPDWIIQPQTEEQISELLSYLYSCKDEAHPFAVAVRSGGHSYAGLSSCHKDISPGFCLQVDMSLFDAFELVSSGDGTVEYIRMGVGLQLDVMAQKTAASPVFVPHGVCKHIGVGGHFQTSALGHWSRTVGLGIDHVESFRIVLADGTVKTVSKFDTEDCTTGGAKAPNSLYWAVLGGNAGSWGILTEVTLNASRLQNADYPNSSVVVYDWEYTKANFISLAGTFIALTKNPGYFQQRDAWPYFLVQPNPETGNPFTNSKITLVLTWSGAGFSGSLRDSGRYDELVKPFIDAAGPPTLRNMEVRAPMSLIGQIVQADSAPLRFYSNHGGSQSPFGDGWIQEVAEVVDAAAKNPLITLLFQLIEYGGAVEDNAQTPWSLNAFPHRSMHHVIDNWIMFPPDELLPPGLDPALMALVARDFKTQFDAVLGIEHYPTLWAMTGAAAYGIDMCEDYHQFYQNAAVFQRLQAVKNCVDPKNIFRNYFTIPTQCDK